MGIDLVKRACFQSLEVLSWTRVRALECGFSVSKEFAVNQAADSSPSDEE